MSFERVTREKVRQVPGFLYYLKSDGFVWRSRFGSATGPERIGTEQVHPEPGFTYFLDEDGYVARARRGEVTFGPDGKPRPKAAAGSAATLADLEGLSRLSITSSVQDVQSAVLGILRAHGLSVDGVAVQVQGKGSTRSLTISVARRAHPSTAPLLASALGFSAGPFEELGSGTDLVEGTRDLQYGWRAPGRPSATDRVLTKGARRSKAVRKR